MNSISNLIAFQSVSDSNYYNSQFIRMINRRKQELVEIQLESNNHISYTLPMIQSAKNNNLPRKKQENKCRYSTKKQIYIKTNYSNLREVRYFYFDSQDQYIRKILLKNGWIETKIKSNHQIDLAWINNDQKFNYQNSQIKFINHFKNNYLLTTKAGLKQTLYKNCSIQRNAEKYFPRCYDLHNELNEFIKDFEKTSVLNILKKYIIYISMDEGLMNKKVYHPSMISKKFMEWIKGKRKFQQHNKPNLLFHKKYLVYSIIFLQKLKNSLDVFIDCMDEHTEEQLYKIPDHIIQQMIAFSKIDPPYHEQLIDDQELWGTPTQQCISLLYSYEKYFEKKYEFYRNDGFDNIWIIKPSESSKGRNLQLISSKKQLKYHSQTCRVIQKYIENIWIFTQKQLKNYKDNNYPKELKLLLNKKFDIRLWVLVKSFEPLQIYLFSEGYLRLTSKNYNLRNLKNFREHFTNYSLNKQNIKKQESFVLLSTFLNHINFNYGYNHLLKEIEQIIISTLKCAEISYSNQSFQLYGFDVLLDCDLKPWLLEVNLSPACDERGKLKQILYKMGEGLLNQLELIDKQKNNEYNWRLIYNEKIENCDTNICNLQISGKPIKKQQLKLLQMRILISSSVLKIKNYFLTKCYKNNLTATERITSRTKVLISILSKNLKKVQFRQKSQIFDVINNFMKKRKSIRIRKSKLKLL